MKLGESERRLLLAGCANAAQALDAWGEWNATADFDRLTEGEYALLPLVFRNLEPLAPQDPAFRKAFAIYRQTWIANQLVLRRAAELGAALAARGIGYALAGAAALALLAYPDSGARPISGLDFLVDPERLRDANEVLVEGDAVRWHAQLLPGVTGRFAASLRSAAMQVAVGASDVNVLAPADLLLIASEQCQTGDMGPKGILLADAWQLLAVLRTPEDWLRVLDQAEAERVTLTLRTALAELESLGADPVPENVRTRLAGSVPGVLERLEYRRKHRAGGLPGRRTSLRVLRYLKARSAARG